MLTDGDLIIYYGIYYLSLMLVVEADRITLKETNAHAADIWLYRNVLRILTAA